MASETEKAEKQALRAALVESPLLAALVAAPLVVGYLEMPLPTLWFSCLVWIALGVRVLAPGLPPLRAPRASWLVVGLPAVAALSFLTSANRGATLITFALFATYAAVTWLAADTVSRGGAPRLLAALLLGGLIVAGLGLQEWGLHARQGDLGWRAFGPFTNQNFFAGYLVPTLLLALGLSFTAPAAFRTSTWMLALGLLTAALTGALMVSGSRGGLLSLGAGMIALVVYGAARKALRDRAAWGRFAVLLVVLGIVVAALFGAVRNRFAAMGGAQQLPAELCPRVATSQAGNSNAFRIKTWEATAVMGLKRPLLGWGAGSFDTAFAPHQIAGFTRHAHNTPLQLLAETGLPGALLWLALPAFALLLLFRVPAPWFWAPAIGAALVAAAVHTQFDSLYYVPAIGLLWSVLLGMALAPDPDLAARMDESARAIPGMRRASPRRMPRLPHKALVGVAAAGLLLCVVLGTGRLYLEQARGLMAERKFSEAVEALSAAQGLLPWDHEVADVQRDAYLYVGRPDDAVAAARRSLELTPERPPSHFYLGQVREGLREDAVARDQYALGLEKAPKEIRLLAAHARISERMGDRGAALEDYRKMVELEESPVGQLRALNEVLDYRFARARMELARAATDPEEAFQHRKKAACFLAERRELFQAMPAAYQSVGDFQLSTERELRTQEAELWEQVAEEFRRRGDNRLAELSVEQAERARTNLETVEKIFADAGVS